MKRIRFTRNSRKHKIGRASAWYVMATTDVDVTTNDTTGDTVLAWVGNDERGRELGIVAIEKPDCFLVIHVQPSYRQETP